VLVFAALLCAAMLWRVLALVHVVHARPLPGIATPLGIALACWELSRITVTVRHVARRRQRRRSFRFACELPAVVATDSGAMQTATIADLSLAGLGLEADDRIEPGSHVRLASTVPTVDGPYHSIAIEGIVRSCRPTGSEAWRLGLEITHIDEDSERVLLTFCHVVYPWRQLRPHDERVARADTTPTEPSHRTDLLDELRREVDAVERAHRSSRRVTVDGRSNELSEAP
jgi:hypothetical protein